MTRVNLLPFALLALLLSPSAMAQDATCGQFFADGKPPMLVYDRLAPRTTLLCNDAYASLASGLTHGALWSAEHP